MITEKKNYHNLLNSPKTDITEYMQKTKIEKIAILNSKCLQKAPKHPHKQTIQQGQITFKQILQLIEAISMNTQVTHHLNIYPEAVNHTI